MWAEAFPKIQAGAISCDSAMDDPKDTRRGLTLLVRPQQAVIANMQNFLNTAIKIASQQYVYPAKDIHLTTLSIFSCKADFTLKEINLDEYKALIKSTLSSFSSLNKLLRYNLSILPFA